MTERPQQLEISLSIQDAKRSSNPVLESVAAPSALCTAAMSDVWATSNAPSSTAAPETQALVPASASSNQEQPGFAPVEEPKTGNPVLQDARYIKYFKMLRYNVAA